MRWRWYHFYFILALFNLLVMTASLALLHRTLSSYQVALGGWGTIDARQRWLTGLRLALLDLNAPGNDVFASRDPARERARFAQLQVHLQLLLRREKEFAVDLTDFRAGADGMIAEEERVFDRITAALAPDVDQASAEQGLRDAGTSMAAMDRAQAAALQSLSSLEQRLLKEAQELLGAHEAELERAAAFEKYFFATIGLALVGMFWYGRQLQRTHDRMEADQRRVEKERNERLAAVGEVCSAVAHGIRNPLAAITSSAQLALRYGTLDEATRLRVQDVLTESQRLDRRVRRLLDFSRTSERPPDRFDLREAVSQAVHEMRPRYDDRGLALQLRAGETPLTVRGNRESLVQAVIELLANSLDHVPTGGSVEVACDRTDGAVPLAVIDVVDNGPGIPEALQQRVFDLFFTSKAEGHGIGLASVRRAAEFHGGDVAVMPLVQTGTHIRMRVPVAEA